MLIYLYIQKMVRNTRVYNKTTFLNSWNNGTTRWVATGENELILLSKENFTNANKLFDKLKEYILNTKKYQVFGN